MTQVSVTVVNVLACFIHHPFETLLRRWNWKAAVMSACVRGTLFFVTNITAGLSAALSAMSIESAFYITTAGFYGAIIQAFRRAHPAWVATLTVMVAIPAINHSLEFLLHWISGTKKLSTSLVASISLSMLSSVFNLFAMRRGALIVGEGNQSLISDLREMPRIILDFLTVIPRWLRQRAPAHHQGKRTEEGEVKRPR